MPTTYTPTNIDQFSSAALNFRGTGVTATMNTETTTDLDLAIYEDRVMTGGVVLTKGSTFGDYIRLQVVDKDNILGYGAGTVLNEFVTNWYVTDDTQAQFPLECPYPAKIISGLYVRIKYTSTGTTAVKLAVNFMLHKVLV